MTHPREVLKVPLVVQRLCSIALWVLILPTARVDGLPYGPHPPEAESGFSFKNFKDFVLAGITPETHTHDPSEIYLHKGQEPAVAIVGVAIPAQEQKLLVENVAAGNQGGADTTLNADDGQPAKKLVVGENGETIQEDQPPKQIEEAVETLDVPHEHIKVELSDVTGDKKLVAGDQQMEEPPAAKVIVIREEI